VFYYPISLILPYYSTSLIYPNWILRSMRFLCRLSTEEPDSPTTFIITVFVPIALAWIVHSTLTTHRPYYTVIFLSLYASPISTSVPPANGMLLFPYYSCLDAFKFFTRSDTHTSRVALLDPLVLDVIFIPGSGLERRYHVRRLQRSIVPIFSLMIDPSTN